MKVDYIEAMNTCSRDLYLRYGKLFK